MMLHFYVEEPSAEAALVELVPLILPDESFSYQYEIFPFQGKQAMLRKLPDRLKAYRHSMEDVRITVLIDRDQQDCIALKQQLENMAKNTGLKTRTRSPHDFQVITRIVIEELEAWYFGDVEAIVSAYPGVDPNLNKKAAYRDPDAIKGGTWEQLEKILSQYHPGGLEKIRAASEIAPHMNPERNSSKSFQVFRDGLRSFFTP